MATFTGRGTPEGAHAEDGDSDAVIEAIEEIILSVAGEIRGMDTQDREYDSIHDLWDFELNTAGKGAAPTQASASLHQKWYASAYIYWENEANCPLSGERLKRCCR
jgi:hypothetical protein